MSYSSMTPSKGFEGMEAGTPTAGRRRGGRDRPEDSERESAQLPRRGPEQLIAAVASPVLFLATRGPPPTAAQAPRSTSGNGENGSETSAAPAVQTPSCLLPPTLAGVGRRRRKIKPEDSTTY